MGLKRITLRDFVIVAQLEIDLGTGFTVLTGETGAGKSILIDALQLALGSRSEVALIREGAERTEVSVEFDASPATEPWLHDAGFAPSESLLLRRTVDTQGKSRAWINGSPATAAQLRELGDQLVDIHGQHAWQSLTRPDAVRALLDAYAGASTAALRALWDRWRQSQLLLTQARAAQGSLQSERERLLWQIGELEQLDPGAHEWEELSSAHTRLSHAQTLLEAAQEALAALEQEDVGALPRLARAHDVLHANDHLEPEFRALVELTSSVLAQAQDAAL
ncbi:MAG: AAA family ATPase, partial [Betaproteobacteria bacterium]